MSGICIVKKHHFTIVNNEVLKDPTLSMAAKGLYSYVMSNADSWKIYKTELINHFSNGKDSIDRAWNELKKAGWLTSEKLRGEDKRFCGWQHTFHHSRLTENPISVDQTFNKPDTNKEQLQNNNNNKISSHLHDAIGEVAIDEMLTAYSEYLPNRPYPRDFKLDPARMQNAKNIWLYCSKLTKKNGTPVYSLPDAVDKQITRDGAIEFWRNYFRHCARSEFLLETMKGLNFDWLVKKVNFNKVRDGGYHG
jgi:hypothetical protein